MKKVLIITYYWPPAGGAGVQRWLKFTKYLPEFGYQPVIYTPENPSFDLKDESLLKDIPSSAVILKQPIREPYQIYNFFTGQKSKKDLVSGFPRVEKDTPLLKRLSVWARGNLFIPDARMWWIRPSIKFLSAYLKDNPVDAIITTGPPHSMHLIGLGLKRRFNIKWIADFRDPWTGIDFYQDMLLSDFADKKHRRLEREILTTADEVLTVGSTLAQELKDLGAKSVSVITNGYDESDLPTIQIPLEQDFSIVHIGSLPINRNPEVLWKALSIIQKEKPELASKITIKFIGKVDSAVVKSAEEAGVSGMLKLFEYLSHKEVTQIQASSSLLLLVVNNSQNAKGILTGKFFEYLASGRPILAIGPADGDVANILRETNAGTMIGYDEVQAMVSAIDQFYRNREIRNSADVSRFSRKSLTRELARLLD